MHLFKKKFREDTVSRYPKQNPKNIFEMYLHGENQNKLTARNEILHLFENREPLFTVEFERRQDRIVDKMFSIQCPIMADTFLSFIQNEYAGYTIEPMIEYLLQTNHLKHLIELLAQNRITPHLDETNKIHNREILIRYIIKDCIQRVDFASAFSLIKAFNKRDNENESVIDIGMEVPFTKILSLNGEDELLAVLKESKGYNQFELICRALGDCGTQKTISYLLEWEDPKFPRPNTLFGVDPESTIATTIDKIRRRLFNVISEKHYKTIYHVH